MKKKLLILCTGLMVSGLQASQPKEKEPLSRLQTPAGNKYKLWSLFKDQLKSSFMDMERSYPHLTFWVGISYGRLWNITNRRRQAPSSLAVLSLSLFGLALSCTVDAIYSTYEQRRETLNLLEYQFEKLNTLSPVKYHSRTNKGNDEIYKKIMEYKNKINSNLYSKIPTKKGIRLTEESLQKCREKKFLTEEQCLELHSGLNKYNNDDKKGEF